MKSENENISFFGKVKRKKIDKRKKIGAKKNKYKKTLKI
jgi:hypothetical protein